MVSLYTLRAPIQAVRWDGSDEVLAQLKELAAENRVEIGHTGDNTLLLVDHSGTRSRRVRVGAYVFAMNGLKVSDGRTFEEFYKAVSDG